MAPMRNPFTPTFGSAPLFMAGREGILRDIERGFDNGPGDPNLSTVFTGARGTGKTALLSYLSREARAHGWISANVSAAPGMLEDVLERANEAVSELAASDATDVKPSPWARAGADGPGPEGLAEGQGNWRTRMNALFKELDRHGVGLLITVDEVRTDLDEMVQLAANYQHFVREGRRVALFMAGLPYRVMTLLRTDEVAFLRRAQMRHLGRIEDAEVVRALAETVRRAGRDISDEALAVATAHVDGNPYLLQLVGYRMWEESPAVGAISPQAALRGAERAEAELRDRILETTYRELSPASLRFLVAMLLDEEESRLSDVARRMGVTGDEASQCAHRLLTDGVIGERDRGVVGFDIPLLRAFLSDREEDLRADLAFDGQLS
ncbi:ATP-binding protein [bacterium]|nr:ATP-binding protein [bacterium]